MPSYQRSQKGTCYVRGPFGPVCMLFSPCDIFSNSPSSIFVVPSLQTSTPFGNPVILSDIFSGSGAYYSYKGSLTRTNRQLVLSCFTRLPIIFRNSPCQCPEVDHAWVQPNCHMGRGQRFLCRTLFGFPEPSW